MSNCPHCGAKPSHHRENTWTCGTIDSSALHFGTGKPNRSDDCRIFELEQRNVKLKAVLERRIYNTRPTGRFCSVCRRRKGRGHTQECILALDKEPGDE